MELVSSLFLLDIYGSVTEGKIIPIVDLKNGKTGVLGKLLFLVLRRIRMLKKKKIGTVRNCQEMLGTLMHKKQENLTSL
jgi:hypothetical protein